MTMAKSSKDLIQHHLEKFKGSVQNGFNSLQHVVQLQHSPSCFYPSTLELQEIIKCGWMKKLGSVLKTWQRKWFVIKGDSLYYFFNENEIKPQGSLFLPGSRIVEHEFKANEAEKFVFDVMPDWTQPQNQESISLAAESEEERADWIKVIKQILYGSKGGAIFGKSLDETLRFENLRESSRKVPEIVESCVEYISECGLKEEGIFRLPGRSSVVKFYREAYDKGDRPNMRADPNMDVHSACSLLKLYLRELPSTLIPEKFYENVIRTVTREMPEDTKLAMESLRSILIDLPMPHYNLLQYMCKFLHLVAQNSDVNKMNFSNLATVFSPAFIQPEVLDDPGLLMATSGPRKAVTHVLIENQAWLFNVDHSPFGGVVIVEDLLGLGETDAVLESTSKSANYIDDLLDIDFHQKDVLKKPLADNRLLTLKRRSKEEIVSQVDRTIVMMRRCTVIEGGTDNKLKVNNRKWMAGLKKGENLEDAFQDWELKRSKPVPLPRIRKVSNDKKLLPGGVSETELMSESLTDVRKKSHSESIPSSKSMSEIIIPHTSKAHGNPLILDTDQEPCCHLVSSHGILECNSTKKNDISSLHEMLVGEIVDIDPLIHYLEEVDINEVSNDDMKSIIKILLKHITTQRNLTLNSSNTTLQENQTTSSTVLP